MCGDSQEPRQEIGKCWEGKDSNKKCTNDRETATGNPGSILLRNSGRLCEPCLISYHTKIEGNGRHLATNSLLSLTEGCFGEYILPSGLTCMHVNHVPLANESNISDACSKRSQTCRGIRIAEGKWAGHGKLCHTDICKSLEKVRGNVMQYMEEEYTCRDQQVQNT